MKKIYIYLLVIFICVLIFLSAYIQEKEGFTSIKHAIVVLTRGYENIEKYDDLIKRNQSIYDIYYSKLKNPAEYDIIIIHEGNITEEQQKYIQDKLPMMPLTFKSITFYKNETINPLCPPTDLSKSFSMGYKNMCYFWSIDFLDILKEYEYIIRIDEDCILEKLDVNILDVYKDKSIYFSSAYFQGDDVEDVIVGLKDIFKEYTIGDIKLPYTNFMIINIPYFRGHNKVQSILNTIKETNCIFSNRWGDLAIWGYILLSIIDKQHYLEDKGISYYHDSHKKKIN
jgi:hypothetical protein